MKNKPDTKGEILIAIGIIAGIIIAIYVIMTYIKVDNEMEVSLEEYHDINVDIHYYHCTKAADIATQELKTKNKITKKGQHKIIDAIETCRVTAEKNEILNFPVAYKKEQTLK